MKFERNLKVQYKSEKCGTSNKRYLLYRFVPSELPLWKRIFCNDWRYIYNCAYTWKTKADEIDDLLGMLFSYDEAVEFIEKHQTFGEVADFLNKVYAEAEQHYRKISNIDTRWNF